MTIRVLIFATRLILAASVLVTATPALTLAQGNGTVKEHQKITTNVGGFNAPLANGDAFGFSSADLGDFDGDGVGDLVVGARATDDGAEDAGAVYIFLLNPNGTVKTHQKISSIAGGFGVPLDALDNFGFDVSSVGDLDRDGVTDLAVGAMKDDDGGPDRGAVWILFLNPDGTVKTHQKISANEGDFMGPLGDGAAFGSAVKAIGDLNGDGVTDLAVGAPVDAGTGTVWILFLDPDGEVKSHQKIAPGHGGFTGALDMMDMFGISIGPGDFDRDGIPDIAVGAFGDDDGGTNRGAVWILLLNPDGTVKSNHKIASSQGGFTGQLDDLDRFGTTITSIRDLSGDGIDDLVVGAFFDNLLMGAIWVLFMGNDGMVVGHQKIDATEGGFTGRLVPRAEFGVSVACPGDVDGDGVHDIAVGAIGDPGSGVLQGAVWILFLNGETLVPVALQSFGSAWVDGHIEVRWTLIDAGDDVTFEIWRRAETAGIYKRIDPLVLSNLGRFTFVDDATRPGRDYTYRVTILEAGAAVTSFETTVTTPVPLLSLRQNHPNPFNPSTTISFTLEREEAIVLQVFDVSGKLIRTLINARVTAGDHSHMWDGRNESGLRVASGAYVIRLKTAGTTLTRKATLLK